MAEIDLTNPEHLAELLRAGLPGFDDETPERVEPMVEVLERSDSDVFALVGAGQRRPPVEQQQQQQQQQPELDPQAPVEQQQVEQLPLDMGGEGLWYDDSIQQDVSTELAPVPVFARRGWTEADRINSKGLHPIYKLAAAHTRSKPIRSAFTGACQAVRVRLPARKPAANAFIGTWVGTVEAGDHLLFSVEEVAQHYADHCGRREVVGRVDLITGARFRGRRFSPVSIYIAYRDASANAKPIFYFLEGGSAKGKPEQLYYAPRMNSEIKAPAGFAFTPFACQSNWYEGGLAMDSGDDHPACVYLTAAQARDGRHEYIKLVVAYAHDSEPKHVIHPFELQVEAALRVLAIADEAKCKLRVGSGGVLQHSLGPTVRALLPWDERPNGTTTPQERDQFCGCPKS